MSSEFEVLMPASEARAQFAEILDRAGYGAERFLIQKSGKNVAVVLGYRDYKFLREREDEFDRNLSKEAVIDETKLTKHSSSHRRSRKDVDHPK